VGSPLRFTFRRVVDAMSVRLEVSNPDATVCEGRLLLDGWRSDAAIRTSCEQRRERHGSLPI
jgi:hypothetical protein